MGGGGSEWFLALFVTALSAGGIPGLAQVTPGFTSLDCGGAKVFNSTNGIEWVPDVNFVRTGRTLDLSSTLNSSSWPPEIQSLRYFPEDSSPRKNCFRVPTQMGRTYLIRAGFFYGNYDGLKSAPVFALSIDASFWTTVVSPQSLQYHEAMTYAGSSSLSVCLVQLLPKNVPFINSLETRSMLPGSYEVTALTGVNLNLIQRTNFGGPFVRYPGDPADRLWSDYRLQYPQMGNYTVLTASRNRSISDPKGTDLPPDIVMQTAVSNPVITVDVLLPSFPSAHIQAYAWLFFAEIDELKRGERRTMDWLCERDHQSVDLTNLLPSHTTLQFGYLNGSFGGSFKCVLSRNSNSTEDPLLNALEVFSIQQKSSGTFAPDGIALQILRDDYIRINAWTGDPCLPIPWNGVMCSEIVPPRVTSLILTSMNLTGPIPDVISRLTALQILDLSNNNFTGTIPSNLSALTSLVVLDLGTNELSGEFPAWLTTDRYPDLQTLSVENNSLNGTFPAEFLNKKGFSFSYAGNIELCSSPGCPKPPPPDHGPALSLPPPPSPNMLANESSMARNQYTASLLLPLGCSLLLSLFGLD